MLHTGLRAQELCTITRSQVKLGKRSGTLLVQGKRNKYREIPLNATARAALVAYDPSLLKPSSGSTPLFLSEKRRTQLTERGLVLQQHLMNSSRREKLWLLENLEHACPSPFFAPALITAEDRLPGPKPRWQVAPGRASGHDPENALDDQAMFQSWASDPGLWE